MPSSTSSRRSGGSSCRDPTPCWPSSATATGFVLEHEETQGDEVARRLLLCEVRDGRIAEVVVYCNGGWDPALRERQAAEAPMLRHDRRAES